MAMLKSLDENSKDYKIYVFAFDDETFLLLKSLNLPNVIPVSLSEFEDDELKKIKQERTFQEYCWTCTSFSILYAITKFNLPQITYLDADLLFFSDPETLLHEMKDQSVLITEHRYTEKYDQSKTSGLYCIQFLSFKNDEYGLEALRWWKNRCAEWCYARHEDGKFGDQKYLDDWTTRFKNVHVLRHLGGGLAPWNAQQYDLFYENDRLQGQEISTGIQFPVVFYHFHDFKFPEIGAWGHSGDYYLKFDVYQLIYKKYLLKLLELNSLCKNINSDLIKLPKKVSAYEWEKLFLPKLDRTDRDHFRAIYKNNHSFYDLDDSFDQMDSSAILKLIQYDFRLEQSYNDYGKIREFVSEPGELNDLLNQNTVRTVLYLKKESGFDWENYIFQNVSCSRDMAAFDIRFAIGEDLNGFLWMPMWKSSCVLNIREIVYESNSEVERIPLKPNHTNGITKESGLYFFHTHPTLQWESLQLTKGYIRISGEWRVLNSWEAYQGIQELLDSDRKQNGFFSINPFPFLWLTSVRIFRRIKSW